MSPWICRRNISKRPGLRHMTKWTSHQNSCNKGGPRSRTSKEAIHTASSMLPQWKCIQSVRKLRKSLCFQGLTYVLSPSLWRLEVSYAERASDLRQRLASHQDRLDSVGSNDKLFVWDTHMYSSQQQGTRICALPPWWSLCMRSSKRLVFYMQGVSCTRRAFQAFMCYDQGLIIRYAL